MSPCEKNIGLGPVSGSMLGGFWIWGSGLGASFLGVRVLNRDQG